MRSCKSKPKAAAEQLGGSKQLLAGDVPKSDAPEPPPVLDRTTPLELLLSLIVGAGICFGYYYVASLLGKAWMIGLGAAWAAMVFRFHFQVWYYGGMKGYLYLTWRYPHCFIYTHTLCLLYNVWKLAALVVHNLNIFFDDRGKMYKVVTPPEGLTLHDYAKMAMDLNKPRQFKKGHTYWWPVICPRHLLDRARRAAARRHHRCLTRRRRASASARASADEIGLIVDVRQIQTLSRRRSASTCT